MLGKSTSVPGIKDFRTIEEFDLGVKLLIGVICNIVVTDTEPIGD